VNDYLRRLGTAASGVHHPNQGHEFTCVNLELFVRVLMDDFDEKFGSRPEVSAAIQQYREQLLTA
jgi:hypothetical protein